MGTRGAVVRAFKIFGSLSICALLLGCAAVIKNDPVNVAGTPDTLANRLDIGFKEDAVENDVVCFSATICAAVLAGPTAT